MDQSNRPVGCPLWGGGGGGGGREEREERGERREKRRNEREKRGKERERGGPYYPSATQMVFICSMHNKTPNNLDKSSEGRATANALNHTIRWCSFVVCTTKPHHNLDKSSEGRATANALNHTISSVVHGVHTCRVYQSPFGTTHTML